jgi:hypothetical protein
VPFTKAEQAAILLFGSLLVKGFKQTWLLGWHKMKVSFGGQLTVGG